MALILADRVRETSTTTGTGALSLAGAVVGYQTFSSAIGNTNTCYYAISNPGVAEWEVGIGTYATSGNTLTRTTILKSSNANAAVNFSAGTKDVFVTYPATKSVYLDASGNVTLAGGLGVGGSAAPGSTGLAVTGTLSATGLVTASGATNGFVTDATNGYALFSGDPANYNISRNSLDIQIKSASTIGALISGTRILSVSSTGLAVTGTLSASGNTNGTFDTTVTNASTGTAAQSRFVAVGGSNTILSSLSSGFTTSGQFQANRGLIYNTGSAGLLYGIPSGNHIWTNDAGVTANMTLSSTGLAVTGTLTLTSDTPAQFLQYGLVSTSYQQYNTFYAFRGTRASPTQVGSGDVMALNGVYAYDNTATLRLQGFTGWKATASITGVNQSAWSVMNNAGTDIISVSPTGLAVTGTLSATGLITGSDAGLNVLQGALKAATASGDGITLGYSTSIDAYDVGVNYSNVNGTESVNAASRASWRTRALDAAATPSYVIGYRAPNAGAGVFTNYMTLDSSGNLLVGATSQPVGTSRAVFSTTGNTQAAIFINDTFNYSSTINWNKATANNNYFVEFATEGTYTARGTITYNRAGGLTVYSTTSDYRLKENIVDLPDALETVSRLKPRQFDWKETGNTTTGFIAHELAEVCPHAVTGEKDATEMRQYEISPAIPATQDEEGNELTAAIEAVMGEREVPRYQGIDTSFLVATLTAAIQQQQAIITALTTRITALEAK